MNLRTAYALPALLSVNTLNVFAFEMQQAERNKSTNITSKGTRAVWTGVTHSSRAALLQMKNILASPILTINIKIGIFNTTAKPVLLYGAEHGEPLLNSEEDPNIHQRLP